MIQWLTLPTACRDSMSKRFCVTKLLAAFRSTSVHCWTSALSAIAVTTRREARRRGSPHMVHNITTIRTAAFIRFQLVKNGRMDMKKGECSVLGIVTIVTGWLYELNWLPAEKSFHSKMNKRSQKDKYQRWEVGYSGRGRVSCLEAAMQPFELTFVWVVALDVSSMWALRLPKMVHE